MNDLISHNSALNVSLVTSWPSNNPVQQTINSNIFSLNYPPFLPFLFFTSRNRKPTILTTIVPTFPLYVYRFSHQRNFTWSQRRIQFGRTDGNNGSIRCRQEYFTQYFGRIHVSIRLLYVLYQAVKTYDTGMSVVQTQASFASADS